MLTPLQPTRLPPPPALCANPADPVGSGAGPANDAPVPFCAPGPRLTVFQDLPDDVVRNVACEIFRASVHDPRYQVDSLACNEAMRATLADELHAAEVLRTIQESRHMPALCAALRRVHTVFPTLRHGCLSAVLHLLPRTASNKLATDALWAEIQALLPTLTRGSGLPGDTADPNDDLLLRLVGALHLHGPYNVRHIEQVLGLLDNQSPPGPGLAMTMLLWAAQMLALPPFTGMDVDVLRQRLVAATPAGFRPRMQQLCDFSDLVRATAGAEPLQAMTAHMAALAKVPDADLEPYLNMAGSYWHVYARRSVDCKNLYQAFFQRLDPRRQVAAIMRGRSPAGHDETASLLHTHIGQLPAAVLLDALADSQSTFLDNITPAHVSLVRSVLETARGTPQFEDLLRKAITFRHVNDEHLGPFLESQVRLANDAERPALELRLGLKLVGCPDLTNRQNGAFETMSRRVDELLTGTGALPAHAVETMVEMNIGWLTVAQYDRLLSLVAALSPDACARCLSRLVHATTRHLPSEEAADRARKLLAICTGLPAEFQSAPLAGVEKVVRYLGPDHDDLRRATALAHDALAPMLRPPIFQATDWPVG